MPVFLIVLLGLLLLLQLLDVYTTRRILSAGGVERNPVIAWLMLRTGKAWPYWKCLPTLLLIALCLAGVLHGELAVLIAMILCGLYALVVAHNWRQLPS
ncbi:DUF5658 family protein [Pokkaliibacter sp. CJK22405]|uniref:DUF5658 family protein n=1 Tax=Pokkaliibacter sp. CJK22405 TaxID=3384615 RepID=UPI00398504B3